VVHGRIWLARPLLMRRFLFFEGRFTTFNLAGGETVQSCPRPLEKAPINEPFLWFTDGSGLPRPLLMRRFLYFESRFTTFNLAGGEIVQSRPRPLEKAPIKEPFIVVHGRIWLARPLLMRRFLYFEGRFTTFNLAGGEIVQSCPRPLENGN